MSWTTITIETLKTRNAGAELTALQESALADGQPDPVTELIEMVVDEVRGYIAGAGVTIGAGSTVPSRLVLAAINRIRYEAATRLPGGALLDDDRREANRQAIELLKRVAAGGFGIEEPETETDEISSGSKSGITIVQKPTRVSMRDDFAGL
jgi:hypothetical protein